MNGPIRKGGVTMDEKRLEEIEERAAKATSPPWAASTKGVLARATWVVSNTEDAIPRAEDQAFVAASRQDVPDLVAEVRKLRALLRRCEWFHPDGGIEACPICGADNTPADPGEHTPDCELAAALGGPPQ